MILKEEQTPALFLDRDGVINIDHGYVYKPQDFEFVPGIFQLCQAALQHNYRIFVFTNQSGIGRGLYSEREFHTLTQWMLQQFSAHGVSITQVYFCPHHPTKAKGEYLIECECRKPKPGMMIKAQRDYQIDMPNSIMIGDKTTDLQAAHAAKIGHRVLFKPEDEPLQLHNDPLGEDNLVTQVVTSLSNIKFNLLKGKK